jgi:alkyl hydroperoxide reductase subunit AhpF
MAFLGAREEAAVKKEFERLGGPVTLTVFASELGPETNAQTVQLIGEVAALSDRLAVKTLNPHIERAEAERYGITVTPTVVVEGARDYGVRFLGIPAGYEFSNLIDIIVAVSRGEASLSAATRSALSALDQDVAIKVFSTPT